MTSLVNMKFNEIKRRKIERKREGLKDQFPQITYLSDLENLEIKNIDP